MMSSRRFGIKRSGIAGAGQGLFARTRMLKGQMFSVEGILVRKNSLEDRCTAYADAYKFRAGNNLLIPNSYGGMVNHSANPNLEKMIIKKKVVLRTLRLILAGEELFFCYSPYAQKRFIRNKS